MAEKSDMKPAPSNCEVEAVGREYTIGRRFCRIALKTLALLFAFCLGFILNEWRYRDRLNGIHFYAYDKHRLKNYYKKLEKEFFDKTGASRESPEAKKFVAEVRELWRPLVEVGPFYVTNDGGEFSVRDILSHSPLVRLVSRGQSKKLLLFSSLEKGWSFPRFMSSFRYSEDGIYKRGAFLVSGEDGKPVISYFDTQGIGVFDTMYVHKNCEQFTYYSNGLSWERKDEQLLDHQNVDVEQLVSPELKNE